MTWLQNFMAKVPPECVVAFLSRSQNIRVGFLFMRREIHILAIQTMIQHSQGRLFLLIDSLEFEMLLPNDLK